MNKLEKLQESTIKTLLESRFTFSARDKKVPAKGVTINNYRVGKTGIRFTATWRMNDADKEYVGYSSEYDFLIYCNIFINNNSEISYKILDILEKPFTELGSKLEDEIVSRSIEGAIAQNYIKLEDGKYVDVAMAKKAAYDNDYAQMTKVSNNELKSTLPGKSVVGKNTNHSFIVLGIFTAYDGKEYVAMKKEGMFADPNIVEIERFKKSYKII